MSSHQSQVCSAINFITCESGQVIFQRSDQVIVDKAISGNLSKVRSCPSYNVRLFYCHMVRSGQVRSSSFQVLPLDMTTPHDSRFVTLLTLSENLAKGDSNH